MQASKFIDRSKLAIARPGHYARGTDGSLYGIDVVVITAARPERCVMEVSGGGASIHRAERIFSAVLVVVRGRDVFAVSAAMFPIILRVSELTTFSHG